MKSLTFWSCAGQFVLSLLPLAALAVACHGFVEVLGRVYSRWGSGWLVGLLCVLLGGVFCASLPWLCRALLPLPRRRGQQWVAIAVGLVGGTIATLYALHDCRDSAGLLAVFLLSSGLAIIPFGGALYEANEIRLRWLTECETSERLRANLDCADKTLFYSSHPSPTSHPSHSP